MTTIRGKYNATPPTVADGQWTDLQLDANGNLKVAATDSQLANLVAGNYETVAASQTDQVLGTTGAIGDYLAGLLIIPATTSPGAVSIEDDDTNFTIFAGGASSLTTLTPFYVPLGIVSVNGAWEVTTGANVSVVAVGNFT